MGPADQTRALLPPTPTILVQPAGMTGEASAESVKNAAAQGIQGTGSPLPHRDQIQAAFGSHDLSNVQAHIGGSAAEASRSMGATAYATGNHVAFRSQPDLHTVAHEAAHVVQQREGVSLAGGVGKVGDPYEKQADAVADRITRGESAADLLPERSKSRTEPATQKKQAGPSVASEGWSGTAATCQPAVQQRKKTRTTYDFSEKEGSDISVAVINLGQKTPYDMIQDHSLAMSNYLNSYRGTFGSAINIFNDFLRSSSSAELRFDYGKVAREAGFAVAKAGLGFLTSYSNAVVDSSLAEITASSNSATGIAKAGGGAAFGAIQAELSRIAAARSSIALRDFVVGYREDLNTSMNGLVSQIGQATKAKELAYAKAKAVDVKFSVAHGGPAKISEGPTVTGQRAKYLTFLKAETKGLYAAVQALKPQQFFLSLLYSWMSTASSGQEIRARFYVDGKRQVTSPSSLKVHGPSAGAIADGLKRVMGKTGQRISNLKVDVWVRVEGLPMGWGRRENIGFRIYSGGSFGSVERGLKPGNSEFVEKNKEKFAQQIDLAWNSLTG